MMAGEAHVVSSTEVVRGKFARTVTGPVAGESVAFVAQTHTVLGDARRGAGRFFLAAAGRQYQTGSGRQH